MKNRNILLYGSNFLFASRLNQIFKRDYYITLIPVDLKSNNDLEINTPEILIKTCDLNDINLVIITSEILTLISSENLFLEFKYFISILNKSKIKLLFISIKKPLLIEINKKTNSLYFNKIKYLKYLELKDDINKNIDLNKNLIYELQSFITSTTSNLEKNPLLFENQDFDYELDHELIYLSNADFYIEELKNLINVNGFIKSNVKTKEIEIKKIYSTYRAALPFKESNSPIDPITFTKQQINCSVEILYRKKPQEIVKNLTLANWRLKFGQKLGIQLQDQSLKEIDYIVPIPETGKYYAQGIAEALKIPYREVFFKKNEKHGRSFDIKDSDERRKFINSKLGIHSGLLKNKSIAIVDEAIFTGATLKIACHLLKEEKIKKLYIFIPSPSCKRKCMFNMQPDRTLLLDYYRESDLRLYFDVTEVYFFNTNSFNQLVRKAGFNCINCFK